MPRRPRHRRHHHLGDDRPCRPPRPPRDASLRSPSRRRPGRRRVRTSPGRPATAPVRVFTTAPNRREEVRPTSLRKPRARRVWTSPGDAAVSARSSRPVRRSRDRASTIRRHTRHACARSRPRTPGRRSDTATTRAPYDGESRGTSRRACRFVPVAETSSDDPRVRVVDPPLAAPAQATLPRETCSLRPATTSTHRGQQSRRRSPRPREQVSPSRCSHVGHPAAADPPTHPQRATRAVRAALRRGGTMPTPAGSGAVLRGADTAGARERTPPHPARTAAQTRRPPQGGRPRPASAARRRPAPAPAPPRTERRRWPCHGEAGAHQVGAHPEAPRWVPSRRPPRRRAAHPDRRRGRVDRTFAPLRGRPPAPRPPERPAATSLSAVAADAAT
jgi:hypothetical protein